MTTGYIKKCSKCNIERLGEEFSPCNTPGKSTRDGLSAWCKHCARENARYRYKYGNGKKNEKIRRQKLKDMGTSDYYLYKEKAKIRLTKYEKSEKGKLTRRLIKLNRKLRTKGRINGKQVKSLLSFYSPEGRCLKCNEIKKLELDHVNPIVMGGTNTIDNIQPLCRTCNSKKYNKFIDYRSDCGNYARSLI